VTLVQDNRHRRLLQFIKRIIEVPLGYSKDDLILLRSAASREYPLLVSLIDEYVRLADRSTLDLPSGNERRARNVTSRESRDMHLFDMLREKKLFPSNSELAEFAGKILPGIKGNRFDKMSRGDIAARVIEYLETKDPRTREALEASMRDAMKPDRKRPIERQSFLSKWERIIKGTQG
jgi:hypothetical protein